MYDKKHGKMGKKSSAKSDADMSYESDSSKSKATSSHNTTSASSGSRIKNLIGSPVKMPYSTN